MDLKVHQCYRETVSIPLQIPAPAKEPLEISGVTPRRRWLPFLDWNWRHFLFFVGVPGAVAAYGALNNWTILQLSGYEIALAFYASHAFVPWWTSALTTALCMRLLKPWRPPQLIILALGSFLACLVILPYSKWITEYFAVGWVSGDPDGRLSGDHIYSQVGFWAFTARATVIWILVNFAFDRFLGLPRCRYDAAETLAVQRSPGALAEDNAEAPAAAASGPADDSSLRFLQRLPANVSPNEVIALKAEQHYIKVYTADRSFMTLYRFSDAVAEMDPTAGHQVHRSYWVRTAAIRAIRRNS
ncbi:MAG: LytTR family transcriptional regulator, partial [Gammaproteobacteria bacterium]|nr:LytTR family transcriptional regulator [Gammaproteobacteria bacterium]